MAYLFTEAARQGELNIRALFAQRNRSRVMVAVFAYFLVAIAGVVAAALVANNSQGDVALLAAAIAAPVFLVALLVARNRIHRIEKLLDQSLDIIAATRSMAIQANVPANEQDQLRDIFYELLDRRTRGLFGEKRTLF